MAWTCSQINFSPEIENEITQSFKDIKTYCRQWCENVLNHWTLQNPVYKRLFCKYQIFILTICPDSHSILPQIGCVCWHLIGWKFITLYLQICNILLSKLNPYSIFSEQRLFDVNYSYIFNGFIVREWIKFSVAIVFIICFGLILQTESVCFW